MTWLRKLLVFVALVLVAGLLTACLPKTKNVTPTYGPTTGGTVVTITGSNFTNVTTVKFGTTSAASFKITGSSTITATTEPHAAGTVKVSLINATGTDTWSGAFAYVKPGTGQPPPTITSISPAEGSATGGTTVIITGDHLSKATAVKFGTALNGSGYTPSVSFTVTSSTTITAKTKAHPAGTVTVSVTTPGGTATSSGDYTFVVPPTVTSFVPTSGSSLGGTTVTVTGTHLTGATAVEFGTTRATTFNVTSPTTITAKTEAHPEGSVKVSVTTPGGTATSSGDYTFIAPPPTITGLSPTEGSTNGGTTVTITGTAFTSASSVEFGTTPATTFTVETPPTTIKAKTKPHPPGTVKVSVTTPKGTATSSGDFKFLAAPVITKVTPSAGPVAGGTVVTLTGLGFVTGGTKVTFGGTTVGVAVVSSTEVRVTSPAHAAGTVTVRATTAGGTSASGEQFTYDAPPTITAFTPTTGATTGGVTVTITGTNLTGASSVTFGTTAATIVSHTGSTSVEAKTKPHAAGTVKISVTTPGGTATSSGDFEFVPPPPTVTGLSPASGPTSGGTRVVIGGTGFLGTTSLTFGDVRAPSFTVDSTTEISATAPAESTGTVTVEVTTPYGTSATSSTDRYTYDTAPTVSSLSVSSGSVTGGTMVTVTGTGFVPGAEVRFGATPATTVSVTSSTSLTAVAPQAASAGTIDVTVTTPGGTSATSTSDQFTYQRNSTGGGGLSNWTAQVASPSLKQVDCTSNTHCVVVGTTADGSGYAAVTFDSGRTWITASLPFGTSPLTSVACAVGATLHCVAVGGKSGVETANGGVTWSTVAPLDDLGKTLGGASCPTSTECVVGATGDMAYTTDGSMNWSFAPISSEYVTSVSCPTAAFCMAGGKTGGNSSEVWVTTGTTGKFTPTTFLKTWTGHAAPTTDSDGVRSVECTSPTNCLEAPEDEVSADGGKTWSGSGVGGAAAFSCAPGTTTCVAAGTYTVAYSVTQITDAYDSQGGIRVSRTNGDGNWALDQDPPHGGERDPFTSVSCGSAEMCMALSTDGITQTFGALTYWVLTTQPLPPAGAVSCPSRLVCYVGQNTGTILKTVDGGAQWSRELPPANAIRSLACPKTNDCVAVATGVSTRTFQRTEILTTVDGGATWHVSHRVESNGTGDSYSNVRCPTATRCYVIGNFVDPNNGTTSGFVIMSSIGTFYGQAYKQVGIGKWLTATHTPTHESIGSLTCPSLTVSKPTAGTCLVLAVNSQTHAGDVFRLTSSLDKLEGASSLKTVTSLSRIACTSLTECYVATQSTLLTNVGHPGSYAKVSLPLPATTLWALSGPECPRASTCVLIATSNSRTYVLTNTAATTAGSTWSADTLPSGTGRVLNASLSCASGSDCWVAGSSTSGRALVFATNGVGGPGTGLIGGLQTLGAANTYGAFNPSEPCFACALQAAGLPAQVLAGDPVDTADGDFTESLPLVDVKGTGPPLAFTATYDAREAQAEVAGGSGPGALGWGWNYDAAMHLAVGATGAEVTITQENGSQVAYVRATSWPQGGCSSGAGGEQCYVPTDPATTATLRYDAATATYVFSRSGGGTTFGFDQAGQVQWAQDTKGERTTFTYGLQPGSGSCPGASGVASCTVETDPSGRTLLYEYDAGGQLIGLTDPAGEHWTFSFGATGNLTSITDPMGRVTSFTYDTADTDANLVHDMVTVTKPNGQPGGPDAGHHETITYDTTTSDATVGWATSTTNPAGQTTSFAYPGVTGTDATATIVTDPEGGETLYSYSEGVLGAVTTGYTTASPSTTIYERNPVTDLPVSVTDPDGHTTTMRFDTDGDLLYEENPDGNVTTSTYNTLGEPLSTVDPTGITTTNTYDRYGDLTATTVTANSSCSTNCTRTTTRTVCEQSTCTVGGQTYTLGEVETSESPRKKVTTYTYDHNGDVATVTDPDGHTTAYAYDQDGRQFCQVEPTAYAAGTRCPLTQTTRVADTTSVTYNPDGEVVTSTDPTGHTTTTAYDGDGNVTSVTDPLGDVTTTTYDAADRPVSVTKGAGTPTASTTTSTYDLPVADCPSAPATALYCTQSAVGTSANLTTDYYDAQGRLVEHAGPPNPNTTSADPQLAATTYAYDPAGLRTSMTDAAGTTNYSYDTAGRLTTVTYANTAAGYKTSSSVSYFYNADGQRTEMKDGTGTTTYGYDGFGEVDAVTDGNGNTVTYGYDPTGDVTCLSYPGTATTNDCQHAASGTGVVTYTYDTAGQMTSMKDWFTKTTSFAYNENGELTTTTFPTTTPSVVADGYDQNANLTSVTLTDQATNPTSPYETTIGSFTYNADEQVATQATTGAAPITFAYDARHDLTGGETASGGRESFTYDTQGGLTSATPTGGSATQSTYNADQQLCATARSGPSCSAPGGGTTLYGYDAMGERCFSATTATTTRTCTAPPTGTSATTEGWDQAGNLVCVTRSNAAGASCASPTPADTTTDAYDGDGLRMSETPAGGSTEHFTWDTLGTVPRLLQDGTYDYLYGPSTTPIEAIGRSSGDRLYVVSDPQGVRLVLTAGGTADGTAHYGSYGTTSSTNPLPIGYDGAYTDSDGLVYLVNRYYTPQSAQFLSVDPLVTVTGQPYAYATGDPVNVVDPLGLGCGWTPGTWGTCAGDALHAVGDAAEGVGHYVAQHKTEVEAAAGIALGAVAIATGVGAIAGGVIIGDVAISAGTLGATSFVAGAAGAALDGSQCSSRDTAACVGLGLNGVSALLGGDSALLDLFTEEGDPSSIASLYSGLGLTFGGAGLTTDILSWILDSQRTTCRQAA